MTHRHLDTTDGMNYHRLFRRGTVLIAIGCCELLMFSAHLVWSRHGIVGLMHDRHENERLAQRVSEARLLNDQLRADIKKWRSSDFLLEKYAREELQLAHPQETIYYLG